MKLYYVYPYVLPLCGTVIDDYQELTQKYLADGLYSEYWNSLLRILLRKYGLPMNRFYHKTMDLLISENTLSFAQSASTWFHDSTIYKQLHYGRKFDNVTTVSVLNQYLTSFIQELKDLNEKRKELCSIYSIVIIPTITLVKHHPTIGSEKWECGALIKNHNIYLKIRRK